MKKFTLLVFLVFILISSWFLLSSCFNNKWDSKLDETNSSTWATSSNTWNINTSLTWNTNWAMSWFSSSNSNLNSSSWITTNSSWAMDSQEIEEELFNDIEKLFETVN